MWAQRGISTDFGVFEAPPVPAAGSEKVVTFGGDPGLAEKTVHLQSIHDFFGSLGGRTDAQHRCYQSRAR
ncbi:hypothetical protein GCM10007159_14830 [Modicisalibacter luteus]|nr:hypothetical protein GCM10007159_14830 [Halomonas lutea]